MNLLKTIARSLPVLLILFWSCQSQDEEEFLQTDTRELEVENYLADAEERFIDPAAKKGADVDPASLTPCNDPAENQYPLIAWYNDKVGHVQVSNDEDYLIATFALEQEDWNLRHTKFVAVVKELKTYKKWGKKYKYYKYKKYVYPMHHTPGTKEYTYVIPLEDLKLDPEAEDKEISFMGIAHVVKRGSHNKYHKFAMAEDRESMGFDGWLIDYTIAECTSLPIAECTFAWADGEKYNYGGGNGFYNIFESTLQTFSTDLVILDDQTGQKTVVGQVEVIFLGGGGIWNLKITLIPVEGVDIPKMRYYAASVPPSSSPDSGSFREVIFNNQDKIELKNELTFSPVYLAVYAEACPETEEPIL